MNLIYNIKGEENIPKKVALFAECFCKHLDLTFAAPF